jgi:ATP-dependent DNA helicase RecQ
VLCEHFTAALEVEACGLCDACVSPEDHVAPEVVEAAAPLGADARAVIVAAIGAMARPMGKLNVARALRGSKAKAVTLHGLDRLPQHGALAAESEEAIVATIEALLGERRLIKAGRKFPTVWLPGKPLRTVREGRAVAPLGGASPKPLRGSRARGGRAPTTDITRALENFRKRKARELKWKAYMVFQQRTIVAIDQHKPTTLDALARIPGLGPAKIARFGGEILDVVRRGGR